MKKIALVVGHRRSSPGAYGNMGISEWSFYNEFVKEIVEKAKGHPVKLKVFHRKEKGNGYGQRMRKLHKEIDAWGADISISFHFNASSNSSASGHEVLYCSSSQRGKSYAELMNKLFSKHLTNKDRGIKGRKKRQRGGGFLCRGRSACILIEPFFASHQHEYVKGGKSRDKLVDSIIDFIASVA